MIVVRKLLLTATFIAVAEAKKAEVPKKIRDRFLVQVEIDDGKGPGLLPRTDTMTCTGIIIKSKIILAPCHCFTNDSVTFTETWRVEIIAGTGNSWDPPPLTQKIKATKIVPHPKCEYVGNGRWDNDLAFIILDSHLDYDEELVFEIKWAPKETDLQALMGNVANCKIHALEPGIKDHPEERPKKLVVTNVTLMDDDTCSRYMCQLVGTRAPLCRTHWWEAGYVCGYDAGCLGGSGGALVCNGLLYGVDTFDLCKGKNYPKPITSLTVIKSLWQTFYAVQENRLLSAWKRPYPKGYNGLIYGPTGKD